MFDERMIQWFCSDEQKEWASMSDYDAPYGLTRADEPHFDEYEWSCNDHDDCAPGQQCTYILWDGTQDGESYANGVACYSWDDEVCPDDEQFGSVNENYNGGTEFSSYTQFQCPGSIDDWEDWDDEGDRSGASNLVAAFATAFAVASFAM